jgi:2-polyprenyl-3-methyl-5-hydroxy-6-metoxy-1,4-benzoquinol methylase
VRGTDWDHNRWYHRLLLAQVPPDATCVLDVGCGAGTLARGLAWRVEHVDAVDRSPAMVTAAAHAAPPNLTVHLADLRTADLPAGHYDAVLSSALLHHLPLSDVLPRMARWVRPGGVLAAVALPRTDLPRELAVELAAAVAHSALGLGFAALRPLTGADLFRPEATHAAMPVAEPDRTVRQVRAEAARLLPGARVRRLLFWRYLLLWHRPAASLPAP